MSGGADTLDTLLARIDRCRLCASSMPHTPRPVLRAHADARLLVVGQAPGRKVHESGVPWDDASGRRLPRDARSARSTVTSPPRPQPSPG